MRYRWIHTFMIQFPVNAMCRVLRVCRSGFYAWLKAPPDVRLSIRAATVDLMRKLHVDSGGVYGSPRVTNALRDRGIRMCLNTVARCMKEAGIKVKPAKRYVPRTTQADPSLRASPNILNRDFSTTGVNQKWCSDITFVRTSEGWLYLATVIDLYSRKIVGWATADHMRTELTVGALTMALQKRDSFKGLIHHSDRGKQYACAQYREILDVNQITQSMSGTGDCYDNAPAESFFATLKKELVNRCQFKTRQEAQQDIFVYIEGFYNRTRLHSAIGYVSPEQFEAA